MKLSERKSIDTMRLTLSGQAFRSLIKALAKENVSVKFKATGNSMLPNILSGDILTVVPYQENSPEVGDIACISVPAIRQVMIHRIIKITNGRLLIKGDNIFKCDGFFDRTSILGYVSDIERKKNSRPVSRLKKQRNVILSKIRFYSMIHFFYHIRIKLHTRSTPKSKTGI